ncbi:SGNH/GDSL hydrolase family protein [Candidatus Beckwithbacteria bacterium]|nr:SGNH/GDSL hydrolase family protein [Candidatus Beckwithbacteria bacterium]
MIISAKTLLAFFLCGAIFGLAISPFVNQKPQTINPQTTPTFAYENQDDKESPETDQTTIKEKFAQIDYEQMRLRFLRSENNKPNVLGTKTESKPSLGSDKNGQATIALIGDSMVDTMGTNLPYLKTSLKNYYPNYQFNLLNYGIGGETVDKGLARVNQNLNYKDRSYNAITASNANIIIIDSFAYNPMDNLEDYKQNLQSLINQIRLNNTTVFFLATIAPLKVDFGKGPLGINWDKDTAYTHATKIQTQMEAAIILAKANGLPVIDCYHQTLQSNGEGIKSYVNSSDGIHPSELGHNFIASQIAYTLALKKILN